MTVICDLPGCESDRVEIRGNDNRLRIEAERDEPQKGRPHQRERSTRVQRTVDLPARADVDEAEATYENGVLKITLPKHEAERDRVIGIQ